MPKPTYYWSNGQKVPLVEVPGAAAVRYREVNAVRRGLISPDFGRALQRFEAVEEIADAHLTVLRSPSGEDAAAIRRALIDFDEVTYVTPIYRRPAGEQVVLTSKFVVQFKPEVTRTEIDALNREHEVSVDAVEAYAPNCFVLKLDDDAAGDVLDVANTYYESGLALFAHPDVVAPRSFRAEPLFARQWHLKNTGQSGGTVGADIRVEGAWALTTGRNEVVIAVIDDGMDADHPDLAPPGKVVAPFDVRSGTSDPRPRSEDDNHGTAVCGVATAARDGVGLCGVAPDCRLMPIRLDGGPILEARAIHHAASNGAWVINCSWGPSDGRWWDAADPLHQRVSPLPDNVRAAIDAALSSGRGGKGCVITWAAGNGNESVSNDGYASHPGVIAVAASSHDDRKSAYSDFGPEVSVCAPSNHFAEVAGSTRAVGGIWTTDRIGALGYNNGDAGKGDAAGSYSNSFGGTSSAAPTVAGVAALVLAANPTLTAAAVKRLLEDTAERIDPQGGQWVARADGRQHSPFYGYGRVNAARAVAEATRRPGAIAAVPVPPPAPSGTTTTVAASALDIPDFPEPAVRSPLIVAAAGLLSDLAVVVAITHTWRGDLGVAVVGPDGTSVMLHDRSGGGGQGLNATFDLASTPALRAFQGKQAAGTWQLVVQDHASRDTGRLVSWELRTVVAAVAATPDRLSADTTVSQIIPDNAPAGLTSRLRLDGAGTVAEVRVEVDITHTYVGDLVVALIAPDGRRALLRSRAGGSADNLITIFTPANAPALALLAGTPIAGDWSLHVADQAARDEGKLNRWAITVRR